jgi:nitrogen regulatory protein PII
VLVLNDTSVCQSVIEAWDEAGAPGETILDSTGVGSIKKALRDDLPLFPNLAEIFKAQEVEHRTIFSVVEGEEMVEKLVESVRNSVAGFGVSANSGFMFVVPVSQVYGNLMGDK